LFSLLWEIIYLLEKPIGCGGPRGKGLNAATPREKRDRPSWPSPSLLIQIEKARPTIGRGQPDQGKIVRRKSRKIQREHKQSFWGLWISKTHSSLYGVQSFDGLSLRGKNREGRKMVVSCVITFSHDEEPTTLQASESANCMQK